MDSGRRGFFKKLLGLGAAVVAAPVITDAAKTKAEVMAAERAAHPLIMATPEWSSNGRWVRMNYMTMGCSNAFTVTTAANYLGGSNNEAIFIDSEVKNG